MPVNIHYLQKEQDVRRVLTAKSILVRINLMLYCFLSAERHHKTFGRRLLCFPVIYKGIMGSNYPSHQMLQEDSDNQGNRFYRLLPFCHQSIYISFVLLLKLVLFFFLFFLVLFEYALVYSPIILIEI